MQKRIILLAAEPFTETAGWSGPHMMGECRQHLFDLGTALKPETVNLSLLYTSQEPSSILTALMVAEGAGVTNAKISTDGLLNANNITATEVDLFNEISTTASEQTWLFCANAEVFMKLQKCGGIFEGWVIKPGQAFILIFDGGEFTEISLIEAKA